MRQMSPRLTADDRKYRHAVLAQSEVLYRLIQIVFVIVGQPHHWVQRHPSLNEEQRRKRRGPKNGAQWTVWSLLTATLQGGGRLVSVHIMPIFSSLPVAYQLATITLHVNATVDSRPAALTGSALL